MHFGDSLDFLYCTTTVLIFYCNLCILQWYCFLFFVASFDFHIGLGKIDGKDLFLLIGVNRGWLPAKTVTNKQ